MGSFQRIMYFLGVLSVGFGAGCANYPTVQEVKPETIEEFREFEEEQKKQLSIDNVVQPEEDPEEVNYRFDQPYFESLEDALATLNRGYSELPKTRTAKIWWLRNHMDEVLKECKYLFAIIGNYTRLEVVEDTYTGDSFFWSIAFGHRQYYQRILRETKRLDSISLRVILEISGRDFDPNTNSSEYDSRVEHLNRSDVLADLYVLGMAQKIMENHNYDIGQKLIEEKIQRVNTFMQGQIDLRRHFNENMGSPFNQELLLAMLIAEKPRDMLSTWNRVRHYPEEPFYKYLRDRTSDARDRYGDARRVLDQSMR